MSKIELKPCPFCGGEGKLIASGFNECYSLVKCEQCGAESGMVRISKEYCADEKAAEAWNRRADVKEINKSEDVREFAEKLKDIVNRKNYMLADIHNSKDFGMFTLGFEQVIDEILEEMEKE